MAEAGGIIQAWIEILIYIFLPHPHTQAIRFLVQQRHVDGADGRGGEHCVRGGGGRILCGCYRQVCGGEER